MENTQIEKTYNKLCKDIYKLIDKYKDDLEPQQLYGVSLSHIFYIMLKTAPKVEYVKDLIDIAYVEAVKSIKDREG